MVERKDIEFWDDARIAEQLIEISAVKDMVAISGGLAWHLMSPPHKEVRALHDHKDVDLFVTPENFQTVIAVLKSRGFEKVWTKYDGVSKDFYRYTKHGAHKIMLDLFVEAVPSVEVGGFNIVAPATLLSFYGDKHTSGDCVAVKAAKILVANGVDPVGRKELVQHAEAGG